MAFKMKKGNIYRGLILRNEKANENYDTDFLYRQETSSAVLFKQNKIYLIQEICFFAKIYSNDKSEIKRSPHSSYIFAKLYIKSLFPYHVNIFAKILLL